MISAPVANLLLTIAILPFIRFRNDKRIFAKRMLYYTYIYIIVHVIIISAEVYFSAPAIVYLPEYIKVIIIVLNILMIYFLTSAIIAYTLPKKHSLLLITAFVYSIITPISIFLREVIIVLVILLSIYYREFLLLGLGFTILLSATILLNTNIEILELLGVLLLIVAPAIFNKAVNNLVIKRIRIPSPIDISFSYKNIIIIGDTSKPPKTMDEFIDNIVKLFGKHVCIVNTTISEKGVDIGDCYGNKLFLNMIDEYTIRAVAAFSEKGIAIMKLGEDTYIGVVKKNLHRDGINYIIVISRSGGITEGIITALSYYIER